MKKTKNTTYFSLVIFFCCALLFSYCDIAKAAPSYTPTGGAVTEDVPFDGPSTQTSPKTTTPTASPKPVAPSPAPSKDNLNFVNNAPPLSPTPSNADIQKFTQGLTNGSTPQGSQGTTMTGGGSFPNPLGNTNSIEGVLGNIMSYLQGIAGTIAVIFIIIGGMMYMVSGGSKEMTERAKRTLIFAIAGLAIVLAAPYFGQEIKAIISGGSPGSALKDILLRILQLLLSIVGFLAIISMVVGGIWMLTALGDEDRYELGKKTAGYSILGLTIALSALIIANQVKSLLGMS